MPDRFSRDRIAATHAQIEACIRRTPLIETQTQDFRLNPGRLHFKLELLQHGGSFKARRAFAHTLPPKTSASAVLLCGGNTDAVVLDA